MSFLAKLGITPDKLDQSTVAFGEWLPDLMALNNPGALEAINVLPTAQGYGPFKSLAPQAGLILPNACKGAIVIKDRLEIVRIFAADQNNIYVRSGAGFANVFTTGIATDPNFLWMFIPFGDNLVAIHPQIPPQVALVSTGAAFSALGGSPPSARCGARVGDFLVLGNLDNEVDPSGARQAYRIRWNGFNRVDLPWVTDPNVQSDFQDMPSEGGEVMGIVGLETGTIFQEHMISRMQEVGLPLVFNIETVENKRGALCTGGIVAAATHEFTSANIYFLSEEGFFVWNGYFSKSISDDKVKKYFFGRLNYSMRSQIVGGLDTVNSCVWWLFPSLGSQQVTPTLETEDDAFIITTEDGVNLSVEDGQTGIVYTTEIMIYSYKNERWSHAFVQAEYVVLAPTTLLPASLDAMFGNLDTDYTVSFDALVSDLGGPIMTGFDGNHTFGPFNGQTMAALIDTSDYTGPNGQRVHVASARPIIDLDSLVATVQVLKHDQILDEAITYGGTTGQEITGECAVLDDARFLRFRVRVPEGSNWNNAVGVEIWRKPSGRI